MKPSEETKILLNIKNFSNYELDRPLPKGKKVVVLMKKDELGGKIMKELATLRPKTYSYLTDHNDEGKKAKDTKKCVIKRKLKFEDYKHCLEATQLENRKNQLEKYKLDADNPRENNKGS